MHYRSASFDSKSRQRGDTLIEALVGVLLMSIVGIGMIHIATRVQQTQTDMHIQNYIVVQMRNLLHVYGTTLCPGNSANSKAIVFSPIDGSPFPLDVQCSTTAGSISLAGRSVAASPQTVMLQTRAMDQEVFGLPIQVGDL
jgi:Tfp pilus assembly protein PilV